MIADLKPYSKMKKSSAPSLGDVPAHWEVTKLRNILKPVAMRRRGDLPLLSVVRERGVIPRDTTSKEENHNVIPEDLSNYKVVKVGQFAMNKMKAWQGSYGVSHYEGIVSPAYFVFDLAQINGDFFHVAIRSRSYVPFFAQASDGVRVGQWDLSQSRMKEAPFAVPPAEEQKAIARFLDHTTRRIDKAIRTKQKLIKLLEEEKQVIIHRGITRGLDPNVSLKPSGIENVGEIPQHWDVSRAGAVCNFISAKAHEQFVDPDGEHICVTARFVSTNGRSFRRCTENLSPARRNDVLMVMSDLPRGRALARAYLVNDDRSYAVNQRVCILRPVRVHPQFLVYAADRHPELLAHDDGFNQTHLPNAAFKTMHLPLPPLKEQMEIAKALARECMMREAVICRTEGEIDLLHEYRARLIADVVTGKLDVREAAKELPEEASDMEAADEAETLADDESAASDEMEETAVEEAEA